jgi:D-serine deaminase-like pyridoxal phosphate-dependent protein
MTTLCRFTLDQPGKAKHTDELRTPSIVINKSIATVNSNRMWRRSEALGCSIRPHVKTHKTIEGALIQTNGRRSKITVSTLAEARFFGNNNFDDILYAVPITSDKLTECSTLNEGLEQFHVMVDNESQLNALEQFRSTFNSTAHLKKWSVVLMIDSGYGRDGVNPTSDSAMDLCRKLINSDHVDFFMTYTHGGNSYHASDVESIKRYSTAERDAGV